MRCDLFAVGLLAVAFAAGCNGDPCQDVADVVIACPEYVEPGATEGKSCTDQQEAQAQCLLDSGLDLCVVEYHPEQLTADQEKIRVGCVNAE